MSWIKDLYDTYKNCEGKEPSGSGLLMPIAHTAQQAHIEIVVDGSGNFRRAALVQKEETVLPATEKSAGRTSGEAAHPLADKIQYCAGDYQSLGGKKEPYFDGYARQLSAWCQSSFRHPSAKAILDYVSKRSIVSDLVKAGILVSSEGVLVVNEKSGRGKKETGEQVPGIFKLLTPKKEGDKSLQDQGDAFVRWRVEIAGDPQTATWEQRSLQIAWQGYEASQRTAKGFCMVSGDLNGVLAEQHPARLRHGGDKAKLISSNDNSGFTFLGRFTESDQAASVSFEVTQKAHNALRWLICRKQAYKNGDQVFIAWAIGGQTIPNLWSNSRDLFNDTSSNNHPAENSQSVEMGDFGQSFAFRLKKVIAGYKANLEDDAGIVVMGLDSATPGRMAILFYRKLNGSEFLNCLEKWHSNFAWPIRFSVDDPTAKKKKRVDWIPSAPSPKSIAEACYGQRVDAKLRKATVERLLPCIIDGRIIPRDLVVSAVRRATNRVGSENWEWEQTLGVACALYKGFHKERQYQMALETDRKTRDYLYGRLLAIGERVEETALYIAKENRDTSAAKLMQRFGDRPFSTWKVIEISLPPYFSRIKARWPGVQAELKGYIDEVTDLFDTKDFTNDTRLTGEFLLGYHCQRQFFKDEIQKRKNISQNKTTQEGEE